MAEPGKEGSGAAYKPYVPDDVRLPEFTWSAVLVGTFLGILFGASSLYLMLKVGMTVSASIPVAVLSITLFRVLARLPGFHKANILENNIVQTAGSAGESIAFGVGATMPALLLLGFEMDISRVMVVAVLGGLLGILMMIPLRRAFIVEKHHELTYPEGTACADVLIVGEQGGSNAKTVFIGFGLAFLYQFLWQGLNLWKEVVRKPLSWFKGASPALEVNPALLGVGYIIGPRIASIMVAGGVLATFVLTPSIRLFGDNLKEKLYPGEKLIAEMSDEEIGKIYVRYIGAGAVAAGGIISVFRALPLIYSSILAGLRDLRNLGGGAGGIRRTEHDLPLWVVGGGAVALVATIWATGPLHETYAWIPDFNMSPVGACLIVVFGFVFVTVSSRLTGEIGSSSNPISGMTVATLLLTCLIFLGLGWVSPRDRLTALSVAGIVCIAASNGGTTSQDLKTGFLVGATPFWQQLAILVGTVSSALVIGWILVGLNQASTVYTAKNLPKLEQPLDVSSLSSHEAAPDGVSYYVWHAIEGNEQKVPPGKYLLDETGQIRYLVDPGINGRISRRDDGSVVRKYNAPQAKLMQLVTDGILLGKLPWALVLLGVSIAVVMELCGISALAFAVGVYLPLSTTAPAFFGGLVRYTADRWGKSAGSQRSEAESETTPASLLSTGYIAGGTIAGVLIAFLNFSEDIPKLLNTWQYREFTLSQELKVQDAFETAARFDLGLPLTGEVPDEKRETLKALTAEIAELNEGMVPQYALVPKGTVLTIPGNKTHVAEEESHLSRFARELLGEEDKAPLLFDLNKDKLKEPETLPKGATLKLPQGNTLALVMFAALVLLLAAVGLGLVLQTPQTPTAVQPAPNSPDLGDSGLASGDAAGPINESPN
jgi:putative OPT family oligopeptide transporter